MTVSDVDAGAMSSTGDSNLHALIGHGSALPEDVVLEVMETLVM